jgi:Ca-activated chloride channel family protein
MSFVWPGMLLLLVLVPVAVAGYVALARHRQRRRAELAAQGFVPTATAIRRRRLRHVPFAFFLAALTLLLVAFARPEVSVGLPRYEGTVILAFDVSNSMLAGDLQPSRLDAAKSAARLFVEDQPDTIDIGVVAFSDGGLVTLPPTDDRQSVVNAIDRLRPLGGTSLGQGIFTSLNAIAGQPIQLGDAAETGSLDDVDIPYFGSAAIVLLSDGENTSDPDPLAVAELASVAGVSIFPIGIGSPEGTVLTIDGFNIATALDEQTLTEIAEVTGGTYSNAPDADALRDVYGNIDLELTTETEKQEATSWFTGASLVLLVVGAALSLLWLGRLV